MYTLVAFPQSAFFFKEFLPAKALAFTLKILFSSKNAFSIYENILK